MARITDNTLDRGGARDRDGRKKARGGARLEVDERLLDADRLQRHHDHLQRQLRLFDRLQPLRSFFDRSMTRAGGTIASALLVVALGLIACTLLGLPAWLAALAVLALVGGLIRFAWVYVINAKENLSALHDAYDRVHGEHTTLLLTCGWEQLRGVPFEDFLVRVFESLGYVVQTTKVSGDHGVDLIAGKGPLVLAIQVKGYPSSTVGNDAVQQAYSGMAFYRRQAGCNRCAVVTNSTFTRAARVAAAELDCALIDRATIPRLIRGELAL